MSSDAAAAAKRRGSQQQQQKHRQAEEAGEAMDSCCPRGLVVFLFLSIYYWERLSTRQSIGFYELIRKTSLVCDAEKPIKELFISFHQSKERRGERWSSNPPLEPSLKLVFLIRECLKLWVMNEQTKKSGICKDLFKGFLKHGNIITLMRCYIKKFC